MVDIGREESFELGSGECTIGGTVAGGQAGSTRSRVKSLMIFLGAVPLHGEGGCCRIRLMKTEVDVGFDLSGG